MSISQIIRRNALKGLLVITVPLLIVSGFFITNSAHAFTSPATVNLGAAADYAILSKSGISNTGPTSITGDIGVSPIDRTALTGFSEIMDSSNQFSTSAYVIGNGKLYAADYTEPTPTNLGTAVLNMEAAYTDAATRPTPSEINPGSAGEIGGLELAPGLYQFTGDSINVLISTNLTLNGGANDVWIFQIPGTLNIASGANISSGIKVLLTGGAQASNIFWAVAGATTLGTYSTFEGNILEAGSVIAIQTGATLNGRALSQFAVTLDANTVYAVTHMPSATTGSGGGGGGGGAPAATTPTPAATAPAVVAAAPVVTPAAGQVLGVATYRFAKTLRYGSEGSDVTELQNRLTSEGVYSGPITGYFGPLTEAGVKAFQAKYDIEQVGMVGPITRTKLNSAVAVATPQGQVLGASVIHTNLTETQIQSIMNVLVAFDVDQATIDKVNAALRGQ